MNHPHQDTHCASTHSALEEPSTDQEVLDEDGFVLVDPDEARSSVAITRDTLEASFIDVLSDARQEEQDSSSHPYKHLSQGYLRLGRGAETSTAHAVEKQEYVRYKRGEKGARSSHSKIVFFKENNPVMSQLEAGLTACCGLLAPNCVPKSRAVYDEDNCIVGIASPLLSDFEPLVSYEDVVEAIEKPKESACLLTISYLFADDDLHRRNLGKRSRIDFDMCCWPLLSELKGLRTLGTDPKEAFPLALEDIINFPVLKEAKPHYWPATYRYLASSQNAYTVQETELFARLRDDEIFRREKYLVLLKFLLIPLRVYKEVLAMHIREDEKIGDFNAIRKIVSWIDDRQKKLRAVLEVDPYFSEYLANPEFLADARGEINLHNDLILAKLRKQKRVYQDQLIDSKEVEAVFTSLSKAIGSRQSLEFSFMQNSS